MEEGGLFPNLCMITYSISSHYRLVVLLRRHRHPPEIHTNSVPAPTGRLSIGPYQQRCTFCRPMINHPEWTVLLWGFLD